MMIKIAVFDDNKPRRELLQMLINSTPEMECTGEFEDCSATGTKNLRQLISTLQIVSMKYFPCLSRVLATK